MNGHVAACAPRRAGGKTFFVLFLSAVALQALGGGCSDEGESSATSSPASTSASASSSGAGGAGGEGQGGQGGQGGSASAGCLEPSAFAELFTIEDDALCAVAVYSADDDIATYASSPTWGSHGGLLSVAKGAAAGSIELTRWQTPSGATGQLMGQAGVIAANIQGDWFVGAQAIDLPFFGWTAVSWTAQFPATGGEVILAKGDVVEQRYDVNSFFAAAGIGTEAKGRLLYSGLSKLESPADSKNGLYAADSCGSPGQDPRLVPDGDASCAAPSAVALWGDSSGPIAVDGAGNVFAVMASFVSGDQELRGFEASTVAPGDAPTSGDTLFKVPGFGTALGAIAPSAGEPGIVAFQPSDAATATSLDVIGQRYSVSSGKVKAEGSPSVLMKLAKAGTFLTITADNQGRLWVGGPQGTGGTLFVVVARPSP